MSKDKITVIWPRFHLNHRLILFSKPVLPAPDRRSLPTVAQVHLNLFVSASSHSPTQNCQLAVVAVLDGLYLFDLNYSFGWQM